MTARSGDKDTRLMGDVATQRKACTGGDVRLGREWSMPGNGSGLNRG